MKGLFDYPSTRKSDPLSSYIAEDKITKSGKRGNQCRLVYDFVRCFEGSTSRELEWMMDLPEVAHRRLPDLEKANLVKRGISRVCKVCRQTCLTWWSTDAAANDG